jgi:modulator of FtsH protease HflC
MNKVAFIVISALIALFVAASTLFVVDQRQFGVLYSFGQIKDVYTEPGLRWKWPAPFQNVVFLDRRVLTLDGSETGSIQTAEKKNLVVDWLVKWRIADARQFIRNNAGGADIRTAEDRLTSVVQDALNSEVTKRTVKDVLSTEREKVMLGVQQRLVDDAKTFGIEIVDVRIKRVDFPTSVAESVFSRMKSERQQVANELRSTGGADGEKIRADADRQREILIAEAYRDAQKVKGDGDAKAAAIYAESFGRDAQFAQFYRQLEAYKTSFAKKSDLMVLDPSSEFFKSMRSGGGSGGAAASPKK